MQRPVPLGIVFQDLSSFILFKSVTTAPNLRLHSTGPLTQLYTADRVPDFPSHKFVISRGEHLSLTIRVSYRSMTFVFFIHD